MPDTNPVANAVSSHYSNEGLLDRVEAALEAAGIGRPARWSDLAPLDQFHVRGLEATKELASALSPRRADAILDVGCGVGGPSRYLAATYGCTVTGIDVCEPYVDVALALAERTGLAGQVTYLHADALELPFPDATFDGAWTQHVAMNIADKARLYGNVYRVLRPRGRFAIYDVVSGNGEPLVFPVPWARSPEISFLSTEDELRDLLSRAGFYELSMIDSTEAGIVWFEKQRVAREAAATPMPLGLQVVMGPDFNAMIGNLMANLRTGRARLIQIVVARP